MALDRLCVGCGIIIDRPFWLCQTCEDQFGVAGVSYAEWPDYLKWLKQDAQREEYSHDNEALSLDEWLEAGELAAEDGNSDSLMAYAPYADEEANRAYRQACGIEERDGREGDIRGDAAAHSVGGEGVG